ncbi:hypothetical protein SAMN03159341_105340 [Paenibacillus sp. 1_12]|uniref:hypothetical protein n=1 Tax=Paenibacillus sp. 1_12 TaxID=1566278 RepID=UPI0008DF5D18|nr:hypothetical protein [Paenibacillus sp. 1_12]SFL37559.1 hypothetical protein SAMN03159341_105340 [Paenibacillus sp. 1_12]
MKIGPQFRDLAVAQGFIAIILFLLIPLANAFGGPSANRMAGILHGVGASMTLLVATYTWHAYYMYVRGVQGARLKLELRLLVTNILVLLTVIIGNWLYIGYQSPEGASEWFKLHLPFGHWVVMEYKEFVSLLTIPCGITAAVFLRRFASSGDGRQEIRYAVGVLLSMMWLCLLIGFVFGLVLSKWKGV